MHGACGGGENGGAVPTGDGVGNGGAVRGTLPVGAFDGGAREDG